MTFYESIWENGLQPELIGFFNDLNWTYIIVFILVLYGIKHTKELDWYKTICDKLKMEKFSNWIASILLGLIFCFFRWNDDALIFNSNYISALLRSILFAVVFSGIFVDIPVVLIKRLGKVIDVNDKPKPE